VENYRRSCRPRFIPELGQCMLFSGSRMSRREMATPSPSCSRNEQEKSASISTERTAGYLTQFTRPRGYQLPQVGRAAVDPAVGFSARKHAHGLKDFRKSASGGYRHFTRLSTHNDAIDLACIRWAVTMQIIRA